MLRGVETELTTSAAHAAAIIRRGGIVAFPTETVYGLGASSADADAIQRIFAAKQRPPDNPLIAHVARVDQIASLTVRISSSAKLLIDRFFPGPLTVVLTKSDIVPAIATAGLDTIGVRQPAHPLAQEFLAACDVPVVAPSANLSGRPSPTTWQAVYADLAGRIDCILQGDQSAVGLESTVVDCSGPVVALLRSGAVTLEQLRELIPDISSAELAGPDEVARSPGMRHRHYAPAATVVLVDSAAIAAADKHAAFVGLEPGGQTDEAFLMVLRCTTVADYAHELFDFFRRCDEAGVHTIYCENVTQVGIGRALMDRLTRAAQR
jgi:L-threonylcarbamoyladenylate synthase